MPYLLPSETLRDSTSTWLPSIQVRTQLVYILLLVLIGGSLIALPLIKVDVSSNGNGLIRPIAEKNELHSFQSGTIEAVLVTDGQHVEKGQPLIRLQQYMTDNKLSQTSTELQQRHQYIHDLTLLTAPGHRGRVSPSELQSPLYRQQLIRYRYAINEQQTTLDRMKTDFDMNKTLYDQHVISKKEYLDKKYEFEKSNATYQSIAEQQYASWQDDLSRYQVESGRLGTDSRQYEKEKEYNVIRAPVSGTLQQFTGRYAGGNLQQGELVGVISPDASMIAECYLSPKDIGTIKPGMPVKLQVDAFNYNEWGLLDGKVLSIDNDFILSGNDPVFKVRCSLSNTCLQLKNGIKGQLKKGMSVRARFVLTRRSLFQLLFDKADDWINPEQNRSYEEKQG